LVAEYPRPGDAENRAGRDKVKIDWQGLAFTLDPATYGE